MGKQGPGVTPAPPAHPDAAEAVAAVATPDPRPLSPAAFSSAVNAITSAFGDPTRRDIYLYVREHAEGDGPDGDTSGVTAALVADRFELHPNVARHHLEKLVAGGYLEVGVGRGPGAGRPSKRYRPAAGVPELQVGVRHDDLLVTLLGKALDRLPPEVAEAMAEEVGAEYGRSLAEAMAPGTDGPDGGADPTAVATRSFRSALHAVADALSSHGFAAHAEHRHGELRIVSAHCPFGDVAVEHPVICAVDRGMVRGMLASLYGDDARPATESSLAWGDDVCVTAVADPRR